MSDTGNETYHERVANGNSRIVVLIKNFYFGLISRQYDELDALIADAGWGPVEPPKAIS